jgi:uncharacterized protein YciI
MTVVATYTYDPSALYERKTIQDEHLQFIKSLEDAGKLLAVGKIADACVDILFLLNVADTAEAQSLLATDPYNRAGYVTRITSHEWSAARGTLSPL